MSHDGFWDAVQHSNLTGLGFLQLIGLYVAGGVAGSLAHVIFSAWSASQGTQTLSHGMHCITGLASHRGQLCFPCPSLNICCECMPSTHGGNACDCLLKCMKLLRDCAWELSDSLHMGLQHVASRLVYEHLSRLSNCSQNRTEHEQQLKQCSIWWLTVICHLIGNFFVSWSFRFCKTRHAVSRL